MGFLRWFGGMGGPDERPGAVTICTCPRPGSGATQALEELLP